PAAAIVVVVAESGADGYANSEREQAPGYHFTCGGSRRWGRSDIRWVNRNGCSVDDGRIVRRHVYHVGLCRLDHDRLGGRLHDGRRSLSAGRGGRRRRGGLDRHVLL